MTFVYFAHAPDIKLLEQSVRALRRIYQNPRIVVFWENGKESFLDGAENNISYFKRGGNLNGYECCVGMLNCLLEAKDDILIKIDCDTILTKPLEKFENFLFFEACQAFLGVGCCYGLSKDVVIKCLSLLSNYTPMGHFKYQEDLTISSLCKLVSSGKLKLWNNCEFIVGYNFDKKWEYYSDKQIIHFGNPDLKFDPRFKKSRDAAHMTLFNDWLESR